MVGDGDAGGALDGLGLRRGMCIEGRGHVGCDRGLIHVLLRGGRLRYPRVCEVWLRVTQRVVGDAVELGLLTVVDSHCHCEGGEVGRGGGEVPEGGCRGGTNGQRSYREQTAQRIQQLKQDGSRVKQRGERRSQARNGGICGLFELGLTLGLPVQRVSGTSNDGRFGMPIAGPVGSRCRCYGPAALCR